MSDRRDKKDRRISGKTRRSQERRRSTGEHHTVIEIVGADLRAVTLKRTTEAAPDQVRVMTVRWRIEATSLNSARGLQELTAALAELIDKHGLQTSNLQFVLGGEFCVTKAVRGTTEEVRSELQRIEQRSRLYLMLGPGEKVTVSMSQPLDARHHYALAAVCNKKTLDTIHEAASRVGMQIDSIEPALVSSSRAVGRLSNVSSEPCLLIHLDESAVELGVCHGGRLLLDYRPGGRTDPEELLELVRTHLSRLQRHVGHQLREPSPRLKRVFLCGQQQAVQRAYSVFSACKQFDAEVIDSAKIQATWELTECASDTASVPALGALLSNYLPKGERKAPNFMEHVLASTREPLSPVIIRSLLPIAAVLLVAAAIFAFNFSKQRSLNQLQQQLDGLVSVQVKERELRLQKGAALSKLEQLKALAGQVHSQPADEIVACIGHCMPSDVWLNRFELNGMKEIQLAGSSYLEAGVFDFVNWLEQSPGFTDVALRSTRPGNSAAGPAIDFNVELSLGAWTGHVEEVARNE